MSYKILVTDNVPEKGFVDLSEEFEIIMPKKENVFSLDEMLYYASFVDAVIKVKWKINKEFIEVAKKLKIISCIGAGYDGVDVQAAKQKGIFVTNNPFAVTESTAEFTVASILVLSR